MTIKVQFSKEYNSNRYWAMSSFDTTDSHTDHFASFDSNVARVRKKLKETFGSISFKDNTRFVFNEAADEAFFIVWSANGIEI
jgi:hypothetical protein